MELLLLVVVKNGEVSGTGLRWDIEKEASSRDEVLFTPPGRREVGELYRS